MATKNLNTMTNAVLAATNAAKQDRIAFGSVAVQVMPPAILSQGRHPSPSSRLEHEPVLRHRADAKAYASAAKRAGRSASFSGIPACLVNLVGQVVRGLPTWRNGTASPTMCASNARSFGADSGRAGSDPFGWHRQNDGRDCLSHDRRDVQTETARGTVRTEKHGK